MSFVEHSHRNRHYLTKLDSFVHLELVIVACVCLTSIYRSILYTESTCRVIFIHVPIDRFHAGRLTLTPKWTRDNPVVDQGSSRSGPVIIPMWTRDWTRDHPGVDQGSPRCGPGIIPEWTRDILGVVRQRSTSPSLAGRRS